MKLIVGLGNPGQEYTNTRHNIGFKVIDQLKDVTKEYRLLKPDTFMNLSGQVVAREANYYKIEPEDIWVIHDDLDLPFGNIRTRLGGSSGGHNGVNSIIEELGFSNFWRFRVGISRPTNNLPAERFVLETFSPEEQKDLPKIIDQAVTLVLESISTGKIKETTLNIVGALS